MWPQPAPEPSTVSRTGGARSLAANRDLRAGGEPGGRRGFQEVSLAAIRQKSPLKDPAKVAPWLYRTAVTQSLLYRRKGRAAQVGADHYAQATQPDEADVRTPDPLDWLLADEPPQARSQGFGPATQRDAEILWLKYTEDWSYQQIAEHLGISQLRPGPAPSSQGADEKGIGEPRTDDQSRRISTRDRRQARQQMSHECTGIPQDRRHYARYARRW